MSLPAKGLLIVFQGIDGTGKSTQLRLLAEELRKRGFPVLTTREPTNGPFGQKIRKLYLDRDTCTPAEELDLFLEDRRQHVREVLNPALAEGQVILCDRYFLSTAAYQGANGFDVGEIIEKNRFAPQPDLALLFQAPPDVGISRITRDRGDILNDFEKAENLARVSEIFNTLDHPSIRKINATRSISTIQNEILSMVLSLLSPSGSTIPEPL
ncbi:MAG: dTMP kinase [Desulfobulbaceae bacterium]|nr:MAG: dTMP kinase [Desulfobulbaceae bacterium]